MRITYACRIPRRAQRVNRDDADRLPSSIDPQQGSSEQALIFLTGFADVVQRS